MSMNIRLRVANVTPFTNDKDEVIREDLHANSVDTDFPDARLNVVMTDPAQFGKFKVGQNLEVTVAIVPQPGR